MENHFKALSPDVHSTIKPVLTRSMFRTVLFLTCISLTARILTAQSRPDFSGVFIRTSPTGQTSATPVIFEISQSPQILSVTARLNGETHITNYDLRFILQRGGATAQIKTKDFIVRSIAEWPPKLPVTRLGVVVPIVSSYATSRRTTEKWELSPDLQTLTIRRKYDYLDGKNITGSDDAEPDTFTRRPSLTSAIAEAGQVTEQCSSKPSFPQSGKNTNIKYDDGVVIGSTFFQQISRCMSLSAILSAKKFERISTAQGDQFLLDSKPVTTFPDMVTLEISPEQVCTTGLNNTINAPVVHQEDFSFQIKWRGDTERDLGTIEAKLLQEPWPELSTPQQFFRLEIPANGIPFNDSLEIRISNREGKHLGCIMGHI